MAIEAILIANYDSVHVLQGAPREGGDEQAAQLEGFVHRLDLGEEILRVADRGAIAKFNLEGDHVLVIGIEILFLFLLDVIDQNTSFGAEILLDAKLDRAAIPLA